MLDAHLQPRLLPWRFIAIFLLLTVGIALSGYLFYLQQKRQMTGERQRELEAVARLKVQQIVNWQQERLADVAGLARSPFLGRYIQQLPQDSSGEIHRELQTWLEAIQRSHDYQDMALVGLQSQVLISTSKAGFVFGTEGRHLIQQSCREQRPLLSDLHFDETVRHIHLDLLAPILSRGPHREPLAVLFIRIDPVRFLYPLIQTWPTPSDTAETLLVRREGDEVLFLNELRHRAGTALTLRLPLSDDLPAGRAARGFTGVMEGRDYRGVPVLAAVLPIPESSWRIVAKVDAEEVFAPLRQRARIITFLTTLMIVCAGAFLGFIWHRQQAVYYRRQFQVEQDKANLLQRYEHLTRHANDIILLIDSGGNLVDANERAVATYGYPKPELLHKTIYELRTPETVAAIPVEMEKVRSANGFVFETRHRRADGSTFPVEVSSRLVAVGGQQLFQSIIRDISERHLAEQALRESEARFRLLFEKAPLPYQSLDADGRLLDVNAKWQETLGYAREEVIGRWFGDFIIPEQQRRFIKGFPVYKERGKVENYEVTLRRRDGSALLALYSGTVGYDLDGNFRQTHCIFADITERKRAELALRDTLEKLQAIIQCSPLSIFILDPEGRVQMWNPAAETMFGWTAAEALGQVLPIVPPEQFSEFKANLQQNLEGVAIVGRECKRRRQDGSDIDVRVYTSPMHDAAGRITGIMALNADITEEKQAAAKIHHLNRLYAVLSQINQTIVRVRRRDDLFADICRIAVEYGGFPLAWIGLVDEDRQAVIPAAVSGQDDGFINAEGISLQDAAEQDGPIVSSILQGRYALCLDAEALPPGAPRREAALARGFHSCGVFPFKVAERVSGVLVVHSGEPNFFTTNEVKLLEEIAADISFALENMDREAQRLRAEKALQDSEELYRMIFNHLPLGVMHFDDQGRIFDFNDRFLEIIGASREQIVGFNLLMGLRDPAMHRAVQDSLEGASGYYEGDYQSVASGKVTPIRAFFHRIVAEDGRFLGAVGLFEDVTERQRLENQIRQSQKLEAIGTLAGGIAHDFNNILMAIIGFAELAQMSALKDQDARANIGEVLKAAHRARGLVKQILTFSRQEKQELKPIPVGPIVAETLKFLRSSLPATIDIRTNFNARTARVLADPTQIHQTVMNLCTNAGHAMRDAGGVLTVGLDEVRLEDADITSYPDLTPGPYVRLTVSDTGHGMPPETLARIFEPFFTTKTREEGTGMGLSVVHGIVKSLGGEIKVYSEPGKGSTFQVLLPLISVEETAAVAVSGEMPTGREHILFVDDEEALAVLGGQMLERLGYRVTVKTSAIEALAAFRERPQGFDLIISDQTMPHLTGAKLAREILQLRPDLPIILCTGFSESLSPEKAQHLAIDALLMKPLSIRDLAVAVRQVLDRQKG